MSRSTLERWCTSTLQGQPSTRCGSRNPTARVLEKCILLPLQQDRLLRSQTRTRLGATSIRHHCTTTAPSTVQVSVFDSTRVYTHAHPPAPANPHPQTRTRTSHSDLARLPYFVLRAAATAAGTAVAGTAAVGLRCIARTVGHAREKEKKSLSSNRMDADLHFAQLISLSSDIEKAKKGPPL